MQLSCSSAVHMKSFISISRFSFVELTSYTERERLALDLNVCQTLKFSANPKIPRAIPLAPELHNTLSSANKQFSGAHI